MKNEHLETIVKAFRIPRGMDGLIKEHKIDIAKHCQFTLLYALTAKGAKAADVRYYRKKIKAFQRKPRKYLRDEPLQVAPPKKRGRPPLNRIEETAQAIAPKRRGRLPLNREAEAA